MQLGERILLATEQAALTRSGLAKKLGVSRQAVNNWIKGKNNPSTKNLSDIADATEVRLEWLALEHGPIEQEHDLNQPSFSAELSTDYLEDVIIGIEQIVAKDKLDLSPRLKAKLIAELYRQALSEAGTDFISESTLRAVIGYAMRFESA
ncbi:MAG: helix-turn-helix domain-containing protein [Pseudomonadota bacterium]